MDVLSRVEVVVGVPCVLSFGIVGSRLASLLARDPVVLSERTGYFVRSSTPFRQICFLMYQMVSMFYSFFFLGRKSCRYRGLKEHAHTRDNK